MFTCEESYVTSWKLHSLKFNQALQALPFIDSLEVDGASLGLSSIISIVRHVIRVAGTVGDKMGTPSVWAIHLH